MNLLPYLLAFAGGILISVQGLMNSAGSKLIGTPALIAWLSIVQALPPLLMIILRQPAIGIGQSLIQGFKWYAVSGLIGIVLVSTLSYSFSKAGALSIFVVIVLGQIIGSAIIDQIGLFGTSVKPINTMKIFSIIIIMVGVWMLLKSEPPKSEGMQTNPANSISNELKRTS